MTFSMSCIFPGGELPPKQFSVIAVAVLALTTTVSCHGTITDPPPRGLLSGRSKWAPFVKGFPSAPTDFKAHFPAGNKDSRLLSGLFSQKRAAGNYWTPFTPLKKGFVWRAGVCGDLKYGHTAGDHLRGGRYYYRGTVVRTYSQGSIFGIRTAVREHHNGFTEAHVCDVSKCGGELSEACFLKPGVCRQLLRAPKKECEDGYSKHCGPTDSKYPGRWYIPCAAKNRGKGTARDPYWSDYAEFFARYRLPADLKCEHCVLHWYWVAADGCNPPGLLQYFQGRNRPKNWGKCPGGGGAVGGFARRQTCGGKEFPEEYYMCSDIRIKPASGARSSGWNNNVQQSPKRARPTVPPAKVNPSTPKPKPKPKLGAKPIPPKKKAFPAPPEKNGSGSHQKGKSPLVAFRLFADGKRIQDFREFRTITVRGARRLAIQVITNRSPKGGVGIFLNGRWVWKEHNWPYFLYGNNGNSPRYGRGLPKNNRFSVMARAEGFQLWSSVVVRT